MGGHSPERFLLQALHGVVFSPSSPYISTGIACLVPLVMSCRVLPQLEVKKWEVAEPCL